jgi:ATP-dependent DNA ligase
LNFEPLIKLPRVTLSVPIAAGLCWTGGGPWVYEEKIDGEAALLSAEGCQLRSSRRRLPGELPAAIAGCTFAGELVTRTSNIQQATFWAFDLVAADGQDLRRRPLRERRAWLRELWPSFPGWMRPIPEGRGGEFLEAVLANGGEGIVAKHVESRYGEPEAWVKCKDQTEDCIVDELHPIRRSARLVQWERFKVQGPKSKVDCGWVSLYGRRLGCVRVGDVVEVRCHHSRHASGRLREARILRIRSDKLAEECLI